MTAPFETYPSGGKSLDLDVFMPAIAGKVPAVLVIHGSFGMDPPYGADIESFAEALAEIGIGAAIPYYLDATDSVAGWGIVQGLMAPTITPDHLVWRQACADALAVMAGDARFDSARMGVLGFSLGGDIALSLAMNPPAAATVRAVVDFFGPTHLLDPNWSRLPPVHIFHGADDTTVYPIHSKRLADALEAAGRTKGPNFAHHVVEGQGHGFNGTALTESRDKTVEFFKRILQDSP